MHGPLPGRGRQQASTARARSPLQQQQQQRLLPALSFLLTEEPQGISHSQASNKAAPVQVSCNVMLICHQLFCVLLSSAAIRVSRVRRAGYSM
ncbi:hypothetical protein FKM82_006744 [Ascaphus truei]